MKKVYGIKLSIALSLTAFNLIIGSLVEFLKLPIYLDTIGLTIACLILGWRYGLIVATLTATVGFFIISPYSIFFLPVLMGVVGVIYLCEKWGLFKSFSKTILAGVINGCASTALSLPIVYLLFGGFSGSGNDLITSYLVNNGLSLIVSVLFSILVTNIIDRVITSLVSVSVVKMLPKTLLENLKQ